MLHWGLGTRPAPWRERVAVVDDEPAVLALYREAIETRGFAVVVGRDCHEGIAARLAEPAPDVMVVNGGMPRLSAPEAIAAIRRHEAAQGLPRVPIVIDSADGPSLCAGLAAGADEAVLRPGPMEHVLEIVERLAGKSGARSASASGGRAGRLARHASTGR